MEIALTAFISVVVIAQPRLDLVNLDLVNLDWVNLDLVNNDLVKY